MNCLIQKTFNRIFFLALLSVSLFAFRANAQQKKADNTILYSEKNKKDNTYKAVPTKFGHKDKCWIMWGPLGVDESELGKICLVYENGRAWPQHKAIKEFMKIAETVDMLTMSKLY